MKLQPNLLASFVALISLIAPSQAQTPQELMIAQAGGLKLLSVVVEEVTLPNSQQKWLKLICSFSTEKAWTDSISLNYEAVVSEPETSSKRLLTGGVSYINIPKGTNTAIMYLTPNTLARFGKPQMLSVFAYRGDQPVGETIMAGSETIPLEEKASFSRFDGAIQNVRFTPWLLLDYGKTPDLATVN